MPDVFPTIPVGSIWASRRSRGVDRVRVVAVVGQFVHFTAVTTRAAEKFTRREVFLARYDEAQINIREVLDAIGRGMRLRIKGDSASLVDATPLNREPIPVPLDLAQQVAEDRRVRQVPEHSDGSFGGWSECGIDGAGASIYALVK